MRGSRTGAEVSDIECSMMGEPCLKWDVVYQYNAASRAPIYSVVKSFIQGNYASCCIVNSIIIPVSGHSIACHYRARFLHVFPVTYLHCLQPQKDCYLTTSPRISCLGHNITFAIPTKLAIQKTAPIRRNMKKKRCTN